MRACSPETVEWFEGRRHDREGLSTTIVEEQASAIDGRYEHHYCGGLL